MQINNRKGKNFVVIMVVIALVAILLRAGIVKIIDLACIQNEALAQTTIKTIATALDNYAQNNQGVYPKSVAFLSQAKPIYLDKDYVALSPIRGYTYSCGRLDAAGYSCYAFPTRCRLTGRMAFTVTTGNLLISEDCRTKE
jgi:hypothetical protein